jgi:hypothetical protein
MMPQVWRPTLRIAAIETAIAVLVAGPWPAIAMPVGPSEVTGGSSVADVRPSARPPTPPTRSDFDGDGYADLAVSGTDVTIDAGPYPGVVLILRGSPAGLTTAGVQRWTAANFGYEDEQFGVSLAAGDFDGDGYGDLAVGSGLLSTVGGFGGNAGAVRIIYGSSRGLSQARSQQWSQSSPGIRGGSELGDGFGSALAAADFGRGGQDDLAIGVAGEGARSGAVNVLYGSRTGLTAAGNQRWTQAGRGVPGKRGAGEQFGLSLAAGHLAGGSRADLAIGVPGDRVGGATGAGSVNVLFGSAAGLTSRGAELWNQGSRGIKGLAETGDRFGQSVAVGHFRGRRTADLAVGAPEENSG